MLVSRVMVKRLGRILRQDEGRSKREGRNEFSLRMENEESFTQGKEKNTQNVNLPNTSHHTAPQESPAQWL